MYYPFLRGRQNELLALQELLKREKLSSQIVPVVEPVKLSPTLVNTLDAFSQAQHSFVFIQNPIVGTISSDANKSKNQRYIERMTSLLGEMDGPIKRGLYVNDRGIKLVNTFKKDSINFDNIIAVCPDPDMLKDFKANFEGFNSKIMVPYAPAFRRIHHPRILTEDKFNKKQRNAEYKDNDDEFFSDDHLYYDEDGYVGFSDYSIIGKEYSESGFAPYAVAIHIVYFNEDNELRVHHFVSDSDEDYSDPAGKFYEALEKLHRWHVDHHMDTIAMQEFERIYTAQTYPGLGIVKRLSVMHHLELMSQFLDGERV